MTSGRQRWLLLLHQIPPSPPYLRAKILRRLKQIGALSLKNSAYLLPDNDEALEDFQWLLKEIRSEGGDAWVLRADVIAGLTDDQIRESFRALREADYQELAADLRDLDHHVTEGTLEAASPEATLRKLRKRHEELSRIDYFEAPGRQELLTLMNEIEQRMSKHREDRRPSTRSFEGRTWVTRRGIKIDRTACCWLIRRFIDPSAKFAFVDPSQYTHQEDELRFDMFEGEYSHEGDSCSFEVLIDRFGLKDPPLRAIAEIVHDLDLKDAKFGRQEAAGIAAMIEGLALRHADDLQRVAEGLVIFDALYAQLRSTSRH